MEFVERLAFIVEGIERVSDTSCSDDFEGRPRQVVEHIHNLSGWFPGELGSQLRLQLKKKIRPRETDAGYGLTLRVTW